MPHTGLMVYEPWDTLMSLATSLWTLVELDPPFMLTSLMLNVVGSELD